jgi:hypothetical protein
MRRTNMNFHTILLRKTLTAVLALVFRIVRILVIDNQALLLNKNPLSASLHSTAPMILNYCVGKHGGV